VHISLHEFGDDVDVLKASLGRGLGHIKDLDDVFMVEELEQFDFSNDALSVYQVFESFRNFLDGHFDFGIVVVSAADHTVGAVPDLFYVFEFVLDKESGAYQVSFVVHLPAHLNSTLPLSDLLEPSGRSIGLRESSFVGFEVAFLL
jgi:hypothetical protein